MAVEAKTYFKCPLCKTLPSPSLHLNHFIMKSHKKELKIMLLSNNLRYFY